jgi:hypothetical protein
MKVIWNIDPETSEYPVTGFINANLWVWKNDGRRFANEMIEDLFMVVIKGGEE